MMDERIVHRGLIAWPVRQGDQWRCEITDSAGADICAVGPFGTKREALEAARTRMEALARQRRVAAKARAGA